MFSDVKTLEWPHFCNNGQSATTACYMFNIMWRLLAPPLDLGNISSRTKDGVKFASRFNSFLCLPSTPIRPACLILWVQGLCKSLTWIPLGFHLTNSTGSIYTQLFLSQVIPLSEPQCRTHEKVKDIFAKAIWDTLVCKWCCILHGVLSCFVKIAFHFMSL